MDADRELLTEAADALDRREAVIRLLEGEVAATTQPAEVTDEQIQAVADSIPGAWRASTLITFARAILALRPVQVSMTDEQHPLMVFAIEAEMGAYQENEIPLAARKAIKAAKTYGITAQAKKEDE